MSSKTIDKLAPKYQAAIAETSDERNNGDGFWIYLAEPFYNDDLECRIIHEQTISACVKELRRIVNRNITKQ